MGDVLRPLGTIGWLLLNAGRRQTFGRVGARLLEHVGDSLELASAGLAVLESAACPVPPHDGLEARIAEVLALSGAGADGLLAMEIQAALSGAQPAPSISNILTTIAGTS